MKFRVRHATAYSYDSGVDLSAHMLHLLPRPRHAPRSLFDRAS